MRRRKKLLILLLLGLLAWVLFKRSCGGASTEADAKFLADRVWIDHFPKDERDLIHQLLLVSEVESGAVGATSRWRVHLELLTYELEGTKLRLELPQERVRLDLAARTWECKGEAPEPFELCLELKGPSRTHRLYSMKSWVIDAREPAKLPAELAPYTSPLLHAPPPHAACEDCRASPAGIFDF